MCKLERCHGDCKSSGRGILHIDTMIASDGKLSFKVEVERAKARRVRTLVFRRRRSAEEREELAILKELITAESSELEKKQTKATHRRHY